MQTQSPIAKQHLLSVAIADAAMLRLAAMPFIVGGGLFVPTADSYQLGDEVLLLLTLPGEAAVPVAGKVVWITPPNNRRGSPPGIGVQLQDAGEALRDSLGAGGPTGSDVPGEEATYTM